MSVPTSPMLPFNPNCETARKNLSIDRLAGLGGYLNGSQLTILNDLVAFKGKWAKIILREPNYVHLRTWGKTRVCLAICLLDAKKSSLNLVITGSEAGTRHWAQEWRRLCEEAPSAVEGLEVNECHTRPAVLSAMMPARQKARLVVLSRALFECVFSRELNNIVWGTCFLDALPPRNFRVCTCSFIFVKTYKSPDDDQVVPRPGSCFTGLGRNPNFPDCFQYDPMPHLLHMLPRSVNLIHRNIVTIGRIPSEVILRKRYELGNLVHRMRVRLAAPLEFVWQEKEEEKKDEKQEAEKQEEEKQEEEKKEKEQAWAEIKKADVICPVCCDARGSVHLSCCSAPDLCYECFHKQFLFSLGKPAPMRCIFCTKPCRYMLPYNRPNTAVQRNRSAVPLCRQVSALRILCELRECAINAGAEDGAFLLIIHQSIVQKHFGSGKRFHEALRLFNGGAEVRILKEKTAVPDWQGPAVFVYEFVNDALSFFADMKLSEPRLFIHARPLQDPTLIEEEFFVALNAACLRNKRITITKMFIE